MGEKEQAARESSAPSISEREMSSPKAAGSQAGMTAEDDWEAPVSRLNALPPGDPMAQKASGGHVEKDPAQAKVSEAGGSEIAIGDPGVNGN